MKKKIGLVVKQDNEARIKADELEKWFETRGIEIIRKENSFSNRRHEEKVISKAPADLFCVFVLGGDGTFLSAVRWIGDETIPIIGVKFGEVGFLAESAVESLFPVAEAVLTGNYKTIPRMRLTINVIRAEEEIVSETVLNDVVVNKGALARLANIDTYIDDHYLTTYRADGLIVATPTGSTAYSLAAGGPIIHPEVPGIIMTPICPFTLTNRPLIVPDSACIELRLAKPASNIMLTFDGQSGLEIKEDDTILVRKGPYPIHMISVPNQHYFDVLKAKLRWSGGRA